MNKKLYVVYDTLGAGRLLGVFDSEDKARLITDKYPSYYKLQVATINEVNKEALQWANSDEQRKFLEELF